MWLIKLSEDLHLPVLLFKDERTLVASLHLILTELDLDSIVFAHLGHLLGLSSIVYQLIGYGSLERHMLSRRVSV